MHAVATQPDKRRIALYFRPVDGLIAHLSPAEHMHAVSAHIHLAYFPPFRLSSIRNFFVYTPGKMNHIPVQMFAKDGRPAHTDLPSNWLRELKKV
jgi:hypothetical protein